MRKANVNAAKTSDGWTALMKACKKGHLEVVRELIKRGANVSATKTTNGKTALMYACQFGNNKEIVRKLCRSGAFLDVSETDKGMTALMFAAQAGRLDICTLLYFELDADRKIVDFDGNTWSSYIYEQVDRIDENSDDDDEEDDDGGEESGEEVFLM
jgi:ankyrin repeat protein